MPLNKTLRNGVLIDVNVKQDDAGAFIIINKNRNKYFYVAAENIDGAITKHSILLEEGNHKNAALQRDYNHQGGEGFSIAVIMSDIDFESAQYIVMELLKVDTAAYNHE